MIKNILPLLAETAKVIDYPEDVIRDVIFHQFLDVKNFIKKPTHARYRLYYLGNLYGNIKSVNGYLTTIIGKLRVERTDALIEEFRLFWRYRRMLQQDKELASYKKRFGSWHWKKTS
jgi:hypothetical protein